MRTSVRRIVLTGFLLAGVVLTTYACPVCYGTTETTSSSGVTMAIMTLLGITGGVLGAIVAFAVRLHKRAKVTLNGDLDLPSLN